MFMFSFEMATINGAGAMGASDECGSLEVGKAADIVIHTLKRPEMITPADRLQQLIYASQSRSVDSVLIDGKFVVLHGKPTTVDLDELAPQFDARQRDIVSCMGFQYRCPWPIIK